MENWTWQWAIFVAVIALAIYVIFFVIVLSFSLVFKKKISKRILAINLLLTQRHDVLFLIDKLFVSNGIKIQPYVAGYLRDSTHFDDGDIDKKTRDEMRENLNRASQAFMYLADQNEIIKNNPNFIDYCKTLNELDDSYRQNVAIYNSDITGYNYWVNFIGYRFLLRLFKLKKKDIIV